MTHPRPRRATWWAAGLLLLVAYAAGLAVRLSRLDQVTLGSDALGQFLGAWTVWSGGVPVPPNPEAGHSLWVGGLLPVLLGGSLREVFAWRFALGALVVPLSAAAAAVWAPKRRWLAGGVAAALTVMDPGLVDTLVVSFRGYGAPELVAAVILLAGLGRTRPWAVGVSAALLVAATGQHPLSVGLALGAPLLWLPAGRAGLVAAGIGLVIGALPRLHWVAQVADCGAGAWTCITAVATGSAEPGVTAGAMVQRAFWDRFAVETGVGVGLVVATGCAAAVGRGGPQRSTAAAAILGTVGILTVGLAIGGLRPYHLRMAAPWLAVGAGVGMACWPVALWVGAAGLLVGGVKGLPPASQPGDLTRVDQLGAALATVTGPVRVEAAWFGDPVGLEPSAVVLSAVQHGLERRQLSVQDDVPVAVIVNLGPRLEGGDAVAEARLHPVLDPVVAGSDARVLLAPSLAVARQWVEASTPPPVVAGGAFDWAKAFVVDAPLSPW